MISIPLIGVAGALVLCAVIAKVLAGGPEKASKSEKAEIMKQLLALSASENSIARKTPAVAARAPLSKPRAPLPNQRQKGTRNV
jgi:hypothetical protein